MNTMKAKTMSGIEVTLPVYAPISGVTVLEDGWDSLLLAAMKIVVEEREGEQMRMYSGGDIVIEVRRPNAWCFEVRIEDEGNRFSSDSFRRMENGDVVKSVNLKLKANWSALGTVPAEHAIDFAKRMTEVFSQVERGLRLWARGQEFVRLYETAEKELRHAEDMAVQARVQDAILGLPETKRNRFFTGATTKKVTAPMLNAVAGRTFEVYVRDGKGRTKKALVAVETGGVCVVDMA